MAATSFVNCPNTVLPDCFLLLPRGQWVHLHGRATNNTHPHWIEGALSQFPPHIGRLPFLRCKQLWYQIRTEVASGAASEPDRIQALTGQLQWRRKNTRLGRGRGCRDASEHSSRGKWSQWNLRLMGRWWSCKVAYRWRGQKRSISGNRGMWMRRKSCRGLKGVHIGTCKMEVKKRMMSKADNVPYLVSYGWSKWSV